jgi:hypothetical protein
MKLVWFCICKFLLFIELNAAREALLRYYIILKKGKNIISTGEPFQGKPTGTGEKGIRRPPKEENKTEKLSIQIKNTVKNGLLVWL